MSIPINPPIPKTMRELEEYKKMLRINTRLKAEAVRNKIQGRILREGSVSKKIEAKKLENRKRKKEAEKQKRNDMMSKYFFLVDTKLIAGEIHSSDDLAEYVHEVMNRVKGIGPYLATINVDNPTEEDYEKIRQIQIRYAFENVNGPDNPKYTKSGKIDRRGASFHAHGTITFRHNTNLTLNKELFRHFMAEQMEELTGIVPFIGKIKYVEGDVTEYYMTKSGRYKDGYEWVNNE
jgi:hypothetical protein